MSRAFLLQGSLNECNKRLEGLKGMAASNPDEGPRTGSEKSKIGRKEEERRRKAAQVRKANCLTDKAFLKQFCCVVE